MALGAFLLVHLSLDAALRPMFFAQPLVICLAYVFPQKRPPARLLTGC